MTEALQVRIVLADDHAMIRDGLRAGLEEIPEFQVIGEAKNGVEALELAKQLCPDMMTVDIDMPRMNGIELIEELHRSYPTIRVLVLSMYNNPHFVRDAFQNGARGYVLKDESTGNIINAIKQATRGAIYISPSIKMAPPSPNHLTRREREVLTLVAEGECTKDIAKELDVDVRTIDAHRANIRRKLETDSIAKWTLFAIRQGWIEGYHCTGPERG